MARGRPAGSKNKKRGGKSKAENSTGAKAAEAEMRKPESPTQLELTGSAIEKKPGQFRTYFNRAVSEYSMYTKAQGRYRETIKEAKEENPLLAEAVKMAIKLVDDEGEIDHDAIKAKLQVHGFLLSEFGSHLQLSLHDTLLGDEKDYAWKRGFERGGTAGMALDMPYPKNSELNEIYSLGWRNGQLKIMGLPYGKTRQTAMERVDSETSDMPEPMTISQAEREADASDDDPMREPMPESEQEMDEASAMH